MTAWSRSYLANSFADTAFEDNGCSDVSFRDICEREGVKRNEKRQLYFRQVLAEFAVFKIRAKHAQYKLVPSPLRSCPRERGLKLQGGNTRIKNL